MLCHMCGAVVATEQAMSLWVRGPTQPECPSCWGRLLAPAREPSGSAPEPYPPRSPYEELRK
jgi:hypothetical protein